MPPKQCTKCRVLATLTSKWHDRSGNEMRRKKARELSDNNSNNNNNNNNVRSKESNRSGTWVSEASQGFTTIGTRD